MSSITDKSEGIVVDTRAKAKIETLGFVGMAIKEEEKLRAGPTQKDRKR